MMKLHPALQKAVKSENTSKEEKRKIYISLYEEDTSVKEVVIEKGGKQGIRYIGAGKFRDALERNGVNILAYDNSLKQYHAEASLDVIQKIAYLDFVAAIEPEPGRYAECLDESTPTIGADYIRGPNVYYNGSGVSVGIIDSGYNAFHQDLPPASYCVDYVEDNCYNDTTGHGTHVAGILLGRGNVYKHYVGVAPGVSDIQIAKVINTEGEWGDFDNSGEHDFIEAVEWMSWSPAPDIVSVSLGTFIPEGEFPPSPANGTDKFSRKVDEAVYENGQIYVVAAGNEYTRWGIYGYEDLTTPGCAKNVITVGATYDFWGGVICYDMYNISHPDSAKPDKIACFSSRGPTGDGRMKPDVVAPGCFVTSCSHLDNDGYVTKAGTSMSTPHVSGLIATLLHHYPWLKGCPGDVKAWLLADALAYQGDKNNVGNTYGFGKVDSYLTHWDILGAEGWDHEFAHGSVNGSTWAYLDITIPSGADRLVVVLTWIEEPADPGAEHALRNNIDLYFKGADQGECAGEWSSTKEYDNVEYIILDNPGADTYRVKICPTWLDPFRSQSFNVSYMIIRGDPTPTSTLTVEANKTAVNVSDSFTVTATITPNSYVASGVYVNLSLPSGVEISSIKVTRKDAYIITYPWHQTYITLGDIPVGDSRSVTWTMSASTHGIKTIQCNAYSSNSGSYSKSIDVFVKDNTPPGGWKNFTPSDWTTDRNPDCTIEVRDTASGLDVSTAYYKFSINSGSTWSRWYGASCTGTNGTTDYQTITASSVQFNHDSDPIDKCQIMFKISDMAGNTNESPAYIVKIDSTDPPKPVISSTTHPDENTWYSNNDPLHGQRLLIYRESLVIATR